MDSVGSGEEQVVSSCEHSNEFVDAISSVEFHVQLCDLRHLLCLSRL